MKKWKKVLIVIISVIALAAAAAASVYHFYIVPKLIEPVLETAAYILNDSTVKKEISDIAAELKEQGLLDAETVNEFIEAVRVEESTRQESEAPKTEPTASPEPQSENEPQAVSEEPAAATTPAPTEPGRKYSYGKKNDAASSEKAETTNGETTTPKPQTSTDSLYERIKSQVSPEDLKIGYSYLNKLDLGTIRSLISNRAELKKYIKSNLTEEEYAMLISLYLKYSYLLNQ